MNTDHLLLQIVFPDGGVYRFPAGGSVEVDLESALAERLVQKGVGLLRNTNHVEQDFRNAFKEVMREIKERVANGH